MSADVSARVHMAGPSRRRALCGSQNAQEQHTETPAEVTCPFCSALFLAAHPEYVLVTDAAEGETP